MAQFMWGRSPPEFPDIRTLFLPAEGSDHQISYVEQNTGMKIFFRCIGNTVLGLMLMMALVLLIPGLFGIRPYVVYSGSMEPEIPTGAVVFTKEGEFSPKKGDIITFHNGDTVVTHRVVKKEKDIFITKGDATRQKILFPQRRHRSSGG